MTGKEKARNIKTVTQHLGCGRSAGAANRPSAAELERNAFRRGHVTHRDLANILPELAARLETVVSDEGAAGLARMMTALTDGGVSVTYLPPLCDELVAGVEAQNWPTVDLVEAEWIDASDPEQRRYLLKPKENELVCILGLSDEAGTYEDRLILEVLPTGLLLSVNDRKNAAVNVACPDWILQALLARQ